jgi:hypothetical protein
MLREQLLRSAGLLLIYLLEVQGQHIAVLALRADVRRDAEMIAQATEGGAGDAGGYEGSAAFTGYTTIGISPESCHNSSCPHMSASFVTILINSSTFPHGKTNKAGWSSLDFPTNCGHPVKGV